MLVANPIVGYFFSIYILAISLVGGTPRESVMMMEEGE